MKNNFLNIIFILFYLFFNANLNADELDIKANQVQINKESETINANDNVQISEGHLEKLILLLRKNLEYKVRIFSTIILKKLFIQIPNQ